MIKKSLIATLLASALVMSAQAKDIVDTAVDAGSFKTLATALGAAGLVETLKGKGPFTVFAPTDEAFAKIPKADLEALLKDKAKLTAVLTYHVVPGKVMAAVCFHFGNWPGFSPAPCPPCSAPKQSTQRSRQLRPLSTTTTRSRVLPWSRILNSMTYARPCSIAKLTK